MKMLFLSKKWGQGMLNGHIRKDPHYTFALIEADKDDNKFVDCAIAANAKCIVTEDVLKHIDSTPEDKYYTLLPEFWEDEEQ